MGIPRHERAQVYETADGRLEAVADAVRRGRMIKCRACAHKGATLGCHIRSCRTSFHFPCARRNGSRLDVRSAPPVLAPLCVAPDLLPACIMTTTHHAASVHGSFSWPVQAKRVHEPAVRLSSLLRCINLLLIASYKAMAGRGVAWPG